MRPLAERRHHNEHPECDDHKYKGNPIENGPCDEHGVNQVRIGVHFFNRGDARNLTKAVDRWFIHVHSEFKRWGANKIDRGLIVRKGKTSEGLERGGVVIGIEISVG